MDRKRAWNQKLFVEIDQASDSCFFTGLGAEEVEGVFVSTWRVIDVGEIVELEIELPRGKGSVRGVVLWTRDPGEATSPGLGVSLVDASEEALDLIRGFCEERAPTYYELDLAV
jgi:hypothetical protein